MLTRKKSAIVSDLLQNAEVVSIFLSVVIAKRVRWQ